MNKHSLSWADHMKFAYSGSAARRELGHNVGILAGLFAVYAVVGTLDYQDQLRTEIAAQEASNRALTATLASCLNGDARFTHDGPHRDGYGKTAVVCRKAEEFKL